MTAVLDKLLFQFGLACVEANAGQKKGLRRQKAVLSQMRRAARRASLPFDRFSYGAALAESAAYIEQPRIRKRNEKQALQLMQQSVDAMPPSLTVTRDAVLNYAAGVLCPKLKQSSQRWARRQLG